jgi:hypothetical protein
MWSHDLKLVFENHPIVLKENPSFKLPLVKYARHAHPEQWKDTIITNDKRIREGVVGI